MVATAMRVVNAVPYVVDAQPGLLSSVDCHSPFHVERSTLLDHHPTEVSLRGMVMFSHLLTPHAPLGPIV